MIGNRWNSGGLQQMRGLLLFGVAMLTVMAATQYYSAVSAEQPEITGPPIPYDHLANQKTDPFLFSGRLMDENHPRWHQFRRALRKYPNVRDCLVEGERKSKEPNLLKIDWRGVGAGASREVCVFRIARSLKGVERIRQWLVYHQFRVGELNRTYSENYTARYEDQPISQITGWWTNEQYREVNPSWLASLTGFDLIQTYQLVIQFSEDLTTVGVGSILASK